MEEWHGGERPELWCRYPNSSSSVVASWALALNFITDKGIGLDEHQCQTLQNQVLNSACVVLNSAFYVMWEIA